MFSPLARGSADWHGGGLLYEQFCDESSQVGPLLPQLSFHSTPVHKSARSASSFVSRDGQITLPKTFVTRKGAIVLFTPSDELLNHGNKESHLKKENVFEAGLKLQTLGNLTNSVLEFGKEADETWQGTLNNQPGNKGDENQPKKDHSAFLHFLHYLDLDNLAADKNVQPGANPDYYLEELRKSSGHSSLKRFRSHTPFSSRTSHSANTYSHFLEDDEEITNIIHEHLKYGKSECSQSAGHMSHGVVSSDHMPDVVREIGHDACEEFFFPLSPRGNDSPFPLSKATVSYRGFVQEGMGDSRPKTASIPPSLESPRANPRITSARPPPVLRALGSTPNHLEEILSADVGFGRYHQTGHSSRLRFIRSSSPPVHPGHSRGASPDLTYAQHLGSPEGKSEDWNRSSNVIEEEHEVSVPIDQSGTDTARRPSSAGGSLRSAVEDRVDIQRRTSSAGATSRNSRKSRRSLCSSRSGSASSVSHHNVRSISALSRDADNNGLSEMSDDIQRERFASARRPDEEDVLCIRHNQTRSDTDVEAEPQSEPPTVEDDLQVVQPHLEDVARSAAQLPKTHSVTSRLGSPSTRSSSAKCVRENAAVSRGSSASSSDVSATWAEAIEKATESLLPVSSRLETMASAQSDRHKTAHVEGGTRTPSASTVNEGRVTEATQGSEVDLTEVSETVVRSQSVAEGVYGDVLNDPDTADQEWPGAMFQEGVEEVQPARDYDDNDNITPELFPTDNEDDSRPSSPHIVPTVKVEESSDTASTRPGDLRAATPEAMFVDERATPEKDANVAPLRESTQPQITPEVNEEVHVTSTPTVPTEPVPKVTTFTRDTAEQHSVGSSHPIPVNARRENQETEDNKTQIEPEQPSRVVPRASSPAPIKADEILHTHLLPSTGLEIEGEVEGRQSPSLYKETIDIEKSRPSSPLAEEKRNVPVSVGEAVLKYIESGQEPQVRERSSRSRRNSETGFEEKINVNTLKEETVSVQKNKGETLIKKEKSTPLMTKPADSTLSVTPKPKASNVGKSKPELKPDLPALDLLRGEEEGMTKMTEPSDEEREDRRQMVRGLLTKPNPPKGGKLELEGIGKETDGSDLPGAEGLVTRVSPPLEKKKTDLSDLAAIINKDKTQSKKEKKVEFKKKGGKPSKSGKKKDDVPVDPKNIDFEAFNTPEMLSEMDDELRQFILEQSSNDLNSTVVDRSNEPMVQEREVLRKESVKTLEVPRSVPEISPGKKDAHSPSKPKKLSKKELTKMRADQRKEERRKKEEEKRLREEETRLLKEREEEAARAKAEAEERQQSIEEEKMRRLVEEEEARREEEEALERLKEAKKKAREEREARRAAEAERRKLEVQKKREEKKKREEELREREKELEQQKMDKERRKAEIEEARRRREEMERYEEEQRREEERLQALHEEEEQRRLEEEQIREAEAELQRLQEEREYREQMRRIAEIQEAKLRQEEEERLRREEEERRRIEEENRKKEEAEKEQKREEQRRVEMSRRLEALARMRAAQAAAHRKALLLKRREQNMARFQNLKFTRCGQHITRPYTFTYFIQIPRKVWEVPIGFNKKKKGFRPARKKPPEP